MKSSDGDEDVDVLTALTGVALVAVAMKSPPDVRLAKYTPDPAYLAKLERLFVELDANQDGRIDPTELTDGLRRLGYKHITVDQIQVGNCIFDTCKTHLFTDSLLELRDKLGYSYWIVRSALETCICMYGPDAQTCAWVCS